MTTAPTRKDYLAMFRRRRNLFLIPFALLLGVSAAVALVLPSEYEATATIQIENQEIPGDLIETTVVVGFIDEHLEALGRRVMTTENLWNLAVELNIYPELRDEEAKHQVASVIRRNAQRDILYVDIGPEDRRRNDSVAVAFTTTFTSGDPRTARDVANGLAELYILESRRGRAERAGQLATFLRTQTAQLAEAVAEQEAKLAAFKEEHGSRLPEFMPHNMRMSEALQGQIDRLNDRINSLNQQRIDLENQLAQVNPRTEVNLSAADPATLTPAQQVERLRLEYMRLSASYSPRHPDLRRLKNDLSTLEGSTPRASQLLNLINVLEEDRERLIQARDRYSERHPDVVRLQRDVSEGRQRVAALGQGDSETVVADNPAYIALQSRLRVVEADMQAEREQRETLTRRMAEFDSRLVSSPTVEQNYRVLTRNHENAVQAYQSARERLRRAEAAERMEETQLGGAQFVLSSRASLPDEPVRPKRAGIVMLGFILAAGSGTGLAAIAEYFNRTVRGARGVLLLAGAPPIATIPVIQTPAERRWQILRTVLLWVLVLAIIAGLTGAAYLYANGFGQPAWL